MTVGASGPPDAAAWGLVVGKFLPPHRGHHLLVDAAGERCLELVVVVSAKSAEPIPLELRHGWMARRHPGAVVVGILDDHPVDFDSDATWQHWADRFRGAWRDASAAPPERRAPDVLFSSEPYGGELARRIGCRHLAVDPDRVALPVSGTLVRDDPFAAWEYLEPAVQAWFARTVVAGDERTAAALRRYVAASGLEGKVVVREAGAGGTTADLVVPAAAVDDAARWTRALTLLDELVARPWEGRDYRPHEPGDRSRTFSGTDA